MDDVKNREEEIRRQIHEVLDLVLDINELQACTKEKTGDHPTAFFEFCGHVGDINVQVHSTGWIPDQSPDATFKSHVDFNDFRFRLSSMVAELKDFAERGVSDGAD